MKTVAVVPATAKAPRAVLLEVVAKAATSRLAMAGETEEATAAVKEKDVLGEPLPAWITKRQM